MNFVRGEITMQNNNLKGYIRDPAALDLAHSRALTVQWYVLRTFAFTRVRGVDLRCGLLCCFLSFL